jgi:hypothetical protein
LAGSGLKMMIDVRIRPTDGCTHVADHPVLVVQEYVGTLRWSPQTKLPQLESSAVTKTGDLESWQTFCCTRLQGTSLEINNEIRLPSPDLIDGEAFPSSLLYLPVVSRLWCMTFRLSLHEEIDMETTCTLQHCRFRSHSAGSFAA